VFIGAKASVITEVLRTVFEVRNMDDSMLVWGLLVLALAALLMDG